MSLHDAATLLNPDQMNVNNLSVTAVSSCADLYMVDLQHGEELVKAGTQYRDG